MFIADTTVHTSSNSMKLQSFGIGKLLPQDKVLCIAIPQRYSIMYRKISKRR